MAISVGSVSVDVIPNTAGIYQRLNGPLVAAGERAGQNAGQIAGQRFGTAMAGAVPNSLGVQIGRQIGTIIGQQVASAISSAVVNGVQTGGRRATASATRAGDDAGGALARSLKARLEAAFKSLPKITVDANTDQADADLQALRARMETLSSKQIGVDLDVAAADAEIADIEAQLRQLGTYHPNVAVRADTAAALAELAAVREQIAEVSATPGVVRLESDGSFGAKLRAQVAAAQAALPEINVTAATGDAEARVAALRASLASLASVRIGIDIDAAVALERIAVIRSALTEVAGSNASIDVRVDAARAESELAAVSAEADELTARRRSLNIDVDTGAAQGKVLALAIELGILAAIEVGPPIAAGILAVASAATVAAIGVGFLAAVAIPAISGIKNVLTLQTQAQQQSTSATNSGAQAAQQAQQKALQLASAEQALATAQRNGALQVQQAEQALTTAQKAEVTAQQALTQARKDAAQQLQDMDNNLVDAQLSQRQAVLAVTDAQAQLTADKAVGAKVTAEQLAKDQLAYDQAVQQLKEQTLATQRLTVQTTAADKAGVKGSATVVQAEQQVSQAKQDVADKTAAVAQAQAQAADAISSAERQIQSAQMQSVSSASSAETAQEKYQKALDALSPSARTLLTSFLHLKSGFLDWSTSLQPTVLPLFSRALDGVSGSLDRFSPLVVAAAGGVSTLEDRLGRELKQPFWVGFLEDLTSSVDPALVGFGTAVGNVFKGSAGVIDAFLPHMTGVASEMDRITGRFAHFGTGLKVNPAFQGFLDYVKTSGPNVAHVIGQILSSLLQVSKALAPISGPVLQLVGAVAQFVGWLARVNPGLLQAFYVVGLLATAFGILDAVLDANPIVLIALALILLVDGVIQAYKHVAWFRDSVNAVWHAIATAALWLWHDVLQPIWAGLVIAFNFVAAAAVWLWRNVLVPAFNAIWLAARIMFAVIAVLVIAPLVIAFKVWAAIGLWLWRVVLAPAFNAIGVAALWLWHDVLQPAINGIAFIATWLWTHAIKPYFGLIVDEIKILASVGTWLWKNVLSPAFHGIATVATWLWKNAIKPAFDAFSTGASWLWTHGLKPPFDLIKTGIGLVGDAFSDAKDFIAKVWGKVEDIAKKPVNFIIQSVYTGGIKAVWDKVADFVKLPHLPAAPKLLAAGGTVGDGFGPAAPMVVNRPTAIVGEGRSQYPEYVIPTDPKYRGRAQTLHQAAGARLMASGGILGGVEDFLGSAVNGAKSVAGKAWNGITDLGEIFLHPTSIWSKLSAPLRTLIDKVGNFPFAREVGRIPTKMLTGLGSKITNFVTGGSGGGGGTGGKGIGTALAWARSQAGKPYQWGGVGNPSWDCSGFMGGIESVLLGQNPDRRLFTTMAFQGANAPAGWTENAPSPFRVGVTNAGVGHMAGTIAGVNVESQGDLGVLVGSKARGWNDRLFSEHYGYTGKYDSGGYLPKGLSTVFNGTGSPEPVLTTAQWDAITGTSTAPVGPMSFEGDLRLDSGEFLGRVRGEAQQVVNTTLTQVRDRARAGAKG